MRCAALLSPPSCAVHPFPCAAAAFAAVVVAGAGCAAKGDEGCARDAAPGAVALELTTRDDVCLAADHYENPQAQSGVLLVHPKGESAADWTSGIVEALSVGCAVVAIDRRGSGASGENPSTVSDDDADRYDVEAGAQALNAAGHGFLFVLGVGESTAAVLDYGVWATGQAGLPAPDGVLLFGATPATETRSSFAALAGAFTPAMVYTHTSDPSVTPEWVDNIERVAPLDWVVGKNAASSAGARLPEAEIEAFLTDAALSAGADPTVLLQCLDGQPVAAASRAVGG